jgi:hypothetical protein
VRTKGVAGGRVVGLTLMHSVVFLVAPLIIACLLSRVFMDANRFTNEEQEQIKKDVAEIKAMLRRERDAAQTSC